ncbi:MAG: hypothetical protein NVSMB6_32480 [Burkholderiaceae bacterium]
MPVLYLLEQGTTIQCNGERIEVRKDDEVLQSVPLVKLEQIFIFGNVQCTTQALKRFLDRNLDVVFLTTSGRFRGRLVGETSPRRRTGSHEAHV